MGAHFRLDLYQSVTWEALDRDLTDTEVVLTEVQGGESIYEIQWPERTALVIGSEAHGLSVEARQRASKRVHIPMRLGVESLNASVAASILIYAALSPGVNSGAR
jgi:TrmH family RNA methyltransferase